MLWRERIYEMNLAASFVDTGVIQGAVELLDIC